MIIPVGEQNDLQVFVMHQAVVYIGAQSVPCFLYLLSPWARCAGAEVH
jgi:hypothetical protein